MSGVLLHLRYISTSATKHAPKRSTSCTAFPADWSDGGSREILKIGVDLNYLTRLIHSHDASKSSDVS